MEPLTRRSGSNPAELAAVWGSEVPHDRAPRLLGLFAHPDDEVFCAGGTIARCAEAGAVTAIVSLTQGEAGQIRDAATATRRVLGTVRVKELEQSAQALGVDHVVCLDLGDGHLAEQPLEELAATARTLIDRFRPDVVVTFGPDGAFGHPDHVTSCLATVEAVRGMVTPPRLLHARFPARTGPGRGHGGVAHVAPTAFHRHRRLRARLQAVRGRQLDARVRRRSPQDRVVPGRFVHHRTGRAGNRAPLHPVGHG